MRKTLLRHHLPHLVVHVALIAGLIVALTAGGITLEQAAHAPTAVRSPARVTGSHLCTPRDLAMGCVLPQATVPEIVRGVDPVAQGVDFGWSCPLSSAQSFGASYLSTDASKNWQGSCVRAFLGAGKKIVMVWETSATRTLDGYGAGQSDARSADAQAHALGAPSGVHIDYAIDFDETSGQAPAVASYFQGVDSVNGASRTGAYGGFYPVTRLCAAHLTTASWQSYAWSGGQWAPASCAPLEQYLNSTSVDYDRAIAGYYGQWPSSSPPPPKPKLACWGKHSTPRSSLCLRIEAQAKGYWKRYLAFHYGAGRYSTALKPVQGRINALQAKKTPVNVPGYRGPGRDYVAGELKASDFWAKRLYGLWHALIVHYQRS